MKKSHIFGILVIAFAIAIIVSSAGDASQYVNFKQAYEMAQGGEDAKVHVVGQLTKNSAGEVTGIEYDPLSNPNFIAFTVEDENKEVQRVICHNPPASMQDFKKSEKVVIIGRCEGKEFVASEILMKCPSKYEDKELKI